ncbi:MAG TPA: hypothetical protein VM639_11760 [Dongiaceae bacterium]|nr:hypothetical protein [Dongiaceae bacterium]
MVDDIKLAHIVIAFNSYGEQRRVIEAAMDIARNHQTHISGIFIHDPVVGQVLEQPFTRYVNSVAASSFAFDRPALDAHFSAIASKLRLSLEASARANALSCSFEVLTDRHFIPPPDADLLVTQANTPFIEQTRRRLTQLIETTSQKNQSLLFIRREFTGRRVIVLVNALSEASSRAVAWAAQLTRRPGQQLWVQAAGPSLSAVRDWLAAIVPEIAAKIGLMQSIPAGAGADVPADLAGGDLLIMDMSAAAASPALLKALLTDTQANLLLIR